MLQLRLLFLTVLVLSFSFVFGDDDDAVCTFGNDGELVDQLDAKDIYPEFTPFQKKFFDAIPSDGFFHKMFNVSFDPNQINKIYFEHCTDFSAKIGLNCAIVACKSVGESSKKASDNGLTELKYFLVIANFLESTLKEEGQLYPDSADDLIKLFLQDMAPFLYADGYAGAKGALSALVDGSVKYFKSLGVSCLKDKTFLVKNYGNQLGKAGKGDIKILL